jgi:hypothetical protein
MDFYKAKFCLVDIDKVINSAFTDSQDEIVPITNELGENLKLTKRQANEIKSKFDNDESLSSKIKIDFIYRLANDFQHNEKTQFFSEATIDSFLETFGYKVAQLKIPEKNEAIH